MQGAAYRELQGQTLEKNPYYPDIPALRKISAHTSPLPMCDPCESLYDLIGDTAAFRLLNYPEEFGADFSRVFFFRDYNEWIFPQKGTEGSAI